jgi:hypothetical protein
MDVPDPQKYTLSCSLDALIEKNEDAPLSGGE